MSVQESTSNGTSDHKPGRPLRSMVVGLCGDNEEQLQHARVALSNVQEVPLEVLDTPGPSFESRPDVYIVLLNEDHDTWNLQITEWGQSRASPAPVLAVIGDRSTEAVRLALRSGAIDVVFEPLDAAELSRTLIKISEKFQPSGKSSATICSLASIAGGVGVSSLTVAIGLALVRLTKKRVALVDLGFQSGALAALLDIDPQHTISELVDPTTIIDSLRLESVLCSHKSGLHLLAAPKRIEESELVTVGTISATLELMRELFDVVLIDSGHHMTEALVAAWEQSHRLLYVVEQSVTSVRPAQRFFELFERLRAEHVELNFVLNRYEPENPFTVTKIEQALKKELWAKVARDDSAFLQLEMESADLGTVAARSPAREAIDAIARDVAGVIKTDQTHSSWLQRLRSAVHL